MDKDSFQINTNNNSRKFHWALSLMPAVLLIFAVPSLAGGVDMGEKLGVLAVLVLAAVLATRYLIVSGKPLGEWAERNAFVLFAIMVFINFVVIFAISLLRLHGYSFCEPDTAYLEQGFWNTGRGKFFYQTQPHGYEGYAGGHASFIFTFLWPVYWLVPRVETLFALRALLITSAALPLFALTRRRLGASMALVFTAVFFLHPIIFTQGALRGVYSPQLGLVFIIGAFWAIDSKRMKTFWILLGFYMLTREHYALTVALFSFYLWWKKRGWKWAVFPFPVAMAYFFIMAGVVMPAVSGGHIRFTSMYSQWGGSMLEIGWNILIRPVEVIQAITAAHNVYYFYYMLLPFGLILLFWRSPEFLLGIPTFFLITLCSDKRTASLENYYGLPILALVCVSSVYGLERWGGRLKKIPKDKLFIAVGVTLLACSGWAFLRLVAVPQVLEGRLFRPYYAGERGEYVNRDDVMAEALKQVPPGESLFLPRYLGLFAAKRDMLSFDGRWEDALPRINYFIIDEKTQDLGTRERFQTSPGLVKLLDSEKVEKVFEKDGVIVYRRR